MTIEDYRRISTFIANGEPVECHCGATAARFSQHTADCTRLVAAQLFGTYSRKDADRIIAGPVPR